MLDKVISLLSYESFTVVFVALNAFALLLCAYDKYAARIGGERVPEKDFILLCLFGASTGMLLGMTVFHHKTKKPKFYIGVPVIFIAQALFYIITVY